MSEVLDDALDINGTGLMRMERSRMYAMTQTPPCGPARREEGLIRRDSTMNVTLFRNIEAVFLIAMLWFVRAFNDDKSYDRFILEQVVGDELNDDDPELLIATGFLRMGPWEHTAMSPESVTRQQYLDDVVNAIGQTFLATPLRCAKCHDHKFDPIPTRD